MSIIYTAQSISNYNATPPPDDGSTGSDNEITWAKHKTKLADPIKTLSEAIDSELQTAFGKVHLNGISAKTTTYTILASDRGRLINCTSGTFTVTLLAAATATNGYEITIYNSGTGVITIDGNASELINGSTTLVLQAGGWAHIVTDGSLWAGPASILPAVTDFTGARNIYIASETPLTTVFDITSIAASTWESVGPTGSGADHIFASLDNIPLDAAGIIIRVKGNITVNSAGSTGLFSFSCGARQTGSVVTTGMNVSEVFIEHVNGNNSRETDISEVMVPTDSSGRFDLVYVQAGTPTSSSLSLAIAGFIK